MNISSFSNVMPTPQPQQMEPAMRAMTQAQDLSKDLVKANVEAMLSLGKMDYIGTIVDMYV